VIEVTDQLWEAINHFIDMAYNDGCVPSHDPRVSPDEYVEIYHVGCPTPDKGQIWERHHRLAQKPRNVYVEAPLVPSSLGELVVFSWCSNPGLHPQVEPVETFLERSKYSHGGKR
jgi:hypothetical protein